MVKAAVAKLKLNAGRTAGYNNRLVTEVFKTSSKNPWSAIYSRRCNFHQHTVW